MYILLENISKIRTSVIELRLSLPQVTAVGLFEVDLRLIPSVLYDQKI